MEAEKFDRSTIDAVLAQSDEQLKATVRAAAEAAGMNRLQTEFMTRDANLIREKLNGITEEDVRGLLARITPEQLSALAEQMKNRKK